MPERLWLVSTRPLVTWGQIEPRIGEHRAYQDGLLAEGKLLASGPFLVGGAARGDGLSILRANDEAEALSLAGADPLVRGGLRAVEVHLWQVNQRAPSVNLGA